MKKKEFTMKTSHAIIFSMVAFAAFINIGYSIGLSFGHNELSWDALKIYDDVQTTKIPLAWLMSFPVS